MAHKSKINPQFHYFEDGPYHLDLDDYLKQIANQEHLHLSEERLMVFVGFSNDKQNCYQHRILMIPIL